MSKIDEISPIEDAAEDGNFERVKFLFEKGVKPDEIEDAMDTAYRGTEVDPPVIGCSKIVEYLYKRGIPIPNYPFYGKRVE
jgi:hypothetical protein